MQIPLFKPQTEWLPPENFPDLSKYDEIAIDLETKDPDLMKEWDQDLLVGKGDVSWYSFSCRRIGVHIILSHTKVVVIWIVSKSFKMVSRCIRYTMQIKYFTTPCMTCVGLEHLGLNINGKIIDTMIASALVDENQIRYDLNNCAKRYTR